MVWVSLLDGSLHCNVRQVQAEEVHKNGKPSANEVAMDLLRLLLPVCAAVNWLSQPHPPIHPPNP